jgi:ketosteroid isomerase-like protein
LFYADDLVVFVAPTQQDIAAIKGIMDPFARASGLHTNIHKYPFTPI